MLSSLVPLLCVHAAQALHPSPLCEPLHGQPEGEQTLALALWNRGEEWLSRHRGGSKGGFKCLQVYWPRVKCLRWRGEDWQKFNDSIVLRYLGYDSIWLRFCDAASIAIRFCDILRFIFPIFFKGMTKENKTDQLTSNVTFNSVNNVIFYTLTEVKNFDHSGHRTIVRDLSQECWPPSI